VADTSERPLAFGRYSPSPTASLLHFVRTSGVEPRLLRWCRPRICRGHCSARHCATRGREPVAAMVHASGEALPSTLKRRSCVAQLTPPFPTLTIHRDRLRGRRSRTEAGLVTRRIRHRPSAAGRWQAPSKTAVGFQRDALAAAPSFDSLGDPCTRGRRCMERCKDLCQGSRGRWRNSAIGTHPPWEAASRVARRQTRPIPNSVDQSGPARTLPFPSSNTSTDPWSRF